MDGLVASSVGQGEVLAVGLPPAVAAPLHTQQRGQGGNDRLFDLIPWSWPGGSHGTPTPFRWSWGSKPGSGASA